VRSPPPSAPSPRATRSIGFARCGNRRRIVDRAVTAFARRHWGSRLDPLAVVVSHLGRGGVLWLAADAALEARDARRPLPTRRVAYAVALGYGSSLLLARILRRDRPCHPERQALIECPDGPGLPSDQTAAAFAGAYAISRRRPTLGPALYAVATAIALARVYCGVHHLSDTLGGAALGTAAARATTR
jgi:membrane-associated phospholipid phosphatase